jgi:hypothetical protein
MLAGRSLEGGGLNSALLAKPRDLVIVGVPFSGKGATVCCRQFIGR